MNPINFTWTLLGGLVFGLLMLGLVLTSQTVTYPIYLTGLCLPVAGLLKDSQS